MAYDSDNLDVHIGANENKWVDPTYYGEGNNIPIGHIALKNDISPELDRSLSATNPDEEVLVEAIMNCELRNQKWEA